MAQCSNSVKRAVGGTKVLPATLWAVEHQIRQLFTSIKPPDVVRLYLRNGNVSETRVKQVCVNQGVHVLILHQTRSYQNPHLGQCCKKWDRVQPLRLFRAHKLPINAWTFSPQVVFYGISKSLGCKGQLISKCLFGVFTFFQKTNESK